MQLQRTPPPLAPSVMHEIEETTTAAFQHLSVAEPHGLINDLQHQQNPDSLNHLVAQLGTENTDATLAAIVHGTTHWANEQKLAFYSTLLSHVVASPGIADQTIKTLVEQSTKAVAPKDWVKLLALKEFDALKTASRITENDALRQEERTAAYCTALSEITPQMTGRQRVALLNSLGKMGSYLGVHDATLQVTLADDPNFSSERSQPVLLRDSQVAIYNFSIACAGKQAIRTALTDALANRDPRQVKQFAQQLGSFNARDLHDILIAQDLGLEKPQTLLKDILKEGTARDLPTQENALAMVQAYKALIVAVLPKLTGDQAKAIYDVLHAFSNQDFYQALKKAPADSPAYQIYLEMRGEKGGLKDLLLQKAGQ